MPRSMIYTETLIVTSCWCGINVAIPDNLYNWMQRKQGNSCYCPMGHQFHFTQTMEERLAEERRRTQAARDLLAAEERSHSATKGLLTKEKKKVLHADHGLCPHCRRHFANLERHVASKHPEVVAAR